ncbi:hypothetical protein AKO1_007048 [Acrasis kona]|uniref:Rhodanese domain-containing protein n=1 Tax=Acrasis kona TaxID=1008807 RepID=A0AAW2YRR9_9EUKA
MWLIFFDESDFALDEMNEDDEEPINVNEEVQLRRQEEETFIGSTNPLRAMSVMDQVHTEKGLLYLQKGTWETALFSADLDNSSDDELSDGDEIDYEATKNPNIDYGEKLNDAVDLRYAAMESIIREKKEEEKSKNVSNQRPARYNKYQKRPQPEVANKPKQSGRFKLEPVLGNHHEGPVVNTKDDPEMQALQEYYKQHPEENKLINRKTIKFITERGFDYEGVDIPFDPEVMEVIKERTDAYENEDDEPDDVEYDTKRGWMNLKAFGRRTKTSDKLFLPEIMPGFQDHLSLEVKKQDIQKILDLPKGVRNHAIVDVRSRERYADFVIPSSINMPLKEIVNGCLFTEEEDFFNLYGVKKFNEDIKLILVSDDSADSELAGWLFNMAGYRYTFNYRGGVANWFGNEFKLIWMKSRTLDMLLDEEGLFRFEKHYLEEDLEQEDFRDQIGDRLTVIDKENVRHELSSDDSEDTDIEDEEGGGDKEEPVKNLQDYARELLNENLPSLKQRENAGLVN